MFEGQRLAKEIELRPDYETGYLEYARDVLHKETGIALFEFLSTHSLPATVNIKEEVIKSDKQFNFYEGFVNDRIRITVDIVPAQKMQVVVPEYINMNELEKAQKEVKNKSEIVAGLLRESADLKIRLDRMVEKEEEYVNLLYKGSFIKKLKFLFGW